MIAPPKQTTAVDREQWATITQHARTNMWPVHWPPGVYMLSLEGSSFLGMDDKGNLYLDGERLYTEKRLARQERVIAWIVAVAAIAAALAATLSALADWLTVLSR